MFLIIIFTDDELKKIQDRDPSVINKIFNEFNKKIYNFIIIRTNGNTDMADEIFSETFKAVIIRLPQLKDIKKIQSWLISIAKNKFVDEIRKQKRIEKIIEKNKLERKYNDDMIEIVHKKQKILMVKMALDNLESRFSDILRLRFYENKSQKEIALILCKSESAVETLLVRAKKTLKKEILRIMKDFDND